MLTPSYNKFLKLVTYQKVNNIPIRDASVVEGRIKEIQVNDILHKIEIKYTNKGTNYITYCDCLICITD